MRMPAIIKFSQPVLPGNAKPCLRSAPGRTIPCHTNCSGTVIFPAEAPRLRFSNLVQTETTYEGDLMPEINSLDAPYA